MTHIPARSNPSAPGRSWRTPLARFPWARLGLVAAVVIVGFSQIFFNVIMRNPGHFPLQGIFHLWVLFWVFVLPFGIVLVLDLLLVRPGRDGRVPRAWRALLLALLAISFVRQAQVYYLGAAELGLAVVYLVHLAVGAGAFLAAFRFPVLARTYAAWLGLLGLCLTGIYVAQTGLLGRAWRRPRPAQGTGAGLREGPTAFVFLFDELAFEVLSKEGKVDRERYPHLAALAEESAWFTRASTNHIMTSDSVPSLLTGKLEPSPETPGVFDRLAERFRFVLVDTLGFASGWYHDHSRDIDEYYYRGESVLLSYPPLDVAKLLYSGFLASPFWKVRMEAPRGPNVPPPDQWYEQDLADWLFREVDFLAKTIDPDRLGGTLVYWHCPLPHPPYILTADGQLHGRQPTTFSSPWEEREKAWENYLEQVGLVDNIVGRLVRRLKEEGIYEEAFLVITSDHGVRSGGWNEPPGYPDVISGLSPNIPVLIDGPGGKPGRRDVDYQHIDFAPTLLDLLDVPYEAGSFEGVSAFSTDRPAREKLFIATNRYVYDGETGRWHVQR